MTSKKRQWNLAHPLKFTELESMCENHREVDLETKPGLTALYSMHSVRMLIERTRWGPQSHSIHSYLHTKMPAPPPPYEQLRRDVLITVPLVGTSSHCTLPSFIASSLDHSNSILSVMGIQCVHKFFTFLPSKNGTQFYCLPM